MDFAARDKCPMAHFELVADAAKDPAVAADNPAAVDNLAASAVADTQVAFAAVDNPADSHNQEGTCNQAASVDSRVDSRSQADNHSRAAAAVEDNRAGSHIPEDSHSRAAFAAGDNLAGSRAAFAAVDAAVAAVAAVAVAAVAVAEVAAAQPVTDAADTKPAKGHATPSSRRSTYHRTQRSVQGLRSAHLVSVPAWVLERLPAASPPFGCLAARTNEGRPAKAQRRQTEYSTPLSTRSPRLHKVSTSAPWCHRFRIERSDSSCC